MFTGSEVQSRLKLIENNKVKMIRKRIVIIALAVFVLFVSGNPINAEDWTGTVEKLQTGKTNFEKKCRLCHSLGSSLEKVDSKRGWTKTVKKMVTYGAHLNSTDRDNVVGYLSGRSSFVKHCGTCHDLTKVVSDENKKTDWMMTVKQMSDHFKALASKGMSKGKTKITNNDKKEIAAFLTVILENN